MLSEEAIRSMYRDVLVALDIGKKAEMGYYDVEMTAYGSVYLKNGERNYLLSMDAAKVYDFCENAVLDDLYPTVVAENFFKKPIPRGFKELLELDLKKDTAKGLQAKYSAEFLNELKNLADMMSQDSAVDLLTEYIGSIKYTFDRMAFDLFESTLVWAMNHKKLGKKDYLILLQELNEERDSISNELRPHDVFNQTFYAVGYEVNGRIEYIYDARKEYVYKKKVALELEGVLVSPIIEETVFYNYKYRLFDARKDFINSLPKIFHEGYWQLLKNIKELPTKMSAQEFEAIADGMREKYGEGINETLKMYANRWDVVR